MLLKVMLAGWTPPGSAYYEWESTEVKRSGTGKVVDPVQLPPSSCGTSRTSPEFRVTPIRSR
jgi:hypothetical protein